MHLKRRENNRLGITFSLSSYAKVKTDLSQSIHHSLLSISWKLVAILFKAFMLSQRRMFGFGSIFGFDLNLSSINLKLNPRTFHPPNTSLIPTQPLLPSFSDSFFTPLISFSATSYPVDFPYTRGFICSSSIANSQKALNFQIH